MADMIMIELDDGNYFYLNLDNIINISFKDNENKILFQHFVGDNHISNNDKAGYQILKNKINKAMEKKLNKNNY